MQQWREPAVEFTRFIPFAFARQFPEILILSRKRDARSGDPTVDAQNGTLQHEVVHPGKDGVAITHGVVQLSDAARITGTFLQRDKVLLVPQFGEHLRCDVVRVTERIIVDHDRQTR